MKVKAAVINAVGEKWQIEEIELDEPKRNEVLVKMVATGVCHSDYHIVTGDIPVSHYPHIGGHEGAGIIEKVGPGVTRVKPGDRVVMSFIPSCGNCKYCRNGRPNLCNEGANINKGSLPDGTYRARNKEGKELGQMCMVGTFREYAVVSEYSVVPIEDHYPLEVACLVGCGVGTGVGAVINRANVPAGSTVAIMGIGGIGANAIQGAVLAGATTIIAIDINDHKLEKAKEFGATHVINASKEDPVARVKEITYNRGVDYSFVTVDYTTPEIIGQGAAMLDKAGVCTVVGIAHPKYQEMGVMPFDMILNEKTVQGTLYGKSDPINDIPRLLELNHQGRLNLEGLITKTYTLEQVNEAFEDMLEHRNIRGVILFD